MPEYLKLRFGSDRLKAYLSGLSLIIYVFTKTSAALFSGGIVLREIAGWNVYVSAVVMIVGTGVYTAVGGLNAVIYTELFQTITLVGGGLLLMAIGFTKVGGMQGLRHDYGVPESFFQLLRPASDPDYPWPGMLICIYAGSLWYWCADQVMVQRALSAQSLAQGRGGAHVAAFLKVLPLFCMSLVGVMCYALYPDEVSKQVDIAYPLMVVRLLPVGLRGLMVSAMLAALMSSLASVFNSCSTLFTLDFWRHYRPTATPRELVLVGRLATLIVIATTMCWLPLMNSSTDQLFVYIQSVSNYLAPPITAVFVAAVFCPFVQEWTVAATLAVGLIVGLSRFILQFVFAKIGISCFYTDVNYLYFGAFLFVVSAVTLVAGTVIQHRAAFRPPAGLTWWTRAQQFKGTTSLTAAEQTANLLSAPPPQLATSPVIEMDQLKMEVFDDAVAASHAEPPEEATVQTDTAETTEGTLHHRSPEVASSPTVGAPQEEKEPSVATTTPTRVEDETAITAKVNEETEGAPTPAIDSETPSPEEKRDTQQRWPALRKARDAVNAFFGSWPVMATCSAVYCVTVILLYVIFR
eukprot:TRINITY_DN2660_c0_g1_i5.p1 TRINITY_DN2660_c0_g1~~TRINITY_DN2660_c0_g1_i5.p1  ORF type:complete len:578 (+),score=101.01 TRINITY_DN2660_c0_g1_i5:171-1904(+)